MKIDVKDLEYNIILNNPGNNDNYIINKITILDKKLTEFLVTLHNTKTEVEIFDNDDEYVATVVANEKVEFVLTFDTSDLITAIFTHDETYLSQITVDIKDIQVDVKEKDVGKRKLYIKYLENSLQDYLENVELYIIVR